MILKTESLEQAWKLSMLTLPEVTPNDKQCKDRNLNCEVYYRIGREQDRVEVYSDHLSIFKGGVFHSQIEIINSTY